MTAYTNPRVVHAPLGLYSHVAKVPAGTELLYFSGQVGVLPDGSTPSTLSGQADQAFANVVALLAANGLEVTDMVRMTTYIVAGLDGEVVREARKKHLGSHRPVSTLLYVSRLSRPDWMVELETIAAAKALS